jgi:predicted lipoprotein with Yx(FWY)xxD motif
MTSRRTAKFAGGGVAVLVISAMVLSGCGSASSSKSSTAAAAAPATSSTTSSTGAASAQQIGMAKGADGTYLTGAGGRAVYLWVADSGGKSACSGACAKAWPPVETKGKPTAGTGVNAADLGTTTRSDGSEQVTYKGHPLYYFIADKSAGEVKGQGTNGFGAKWWLVTPAGDAITKSASSGGASSGGGYSSGGSTSSTSSSSGGWG